MNCCCSVTKLSDSFATPWTTAHQAPLSMGFPRQEYWNDLPFPSPGDMHNTGTEPAPPALADGFVTTEPAGKPNKYMLNNNYFKHQWTKCPD